MLIPVRALPGAKTRLARTLTPDVHARLVAAIRADTLAAVRATPAVARVVVVGDVPGDEVTLVQTSSGLNGALRDAARYAVANWPGDGVAAVVGDLPALRPDELDAALRTAAGHPAAFVPDAGGTGTTMLTAAPGTTLDPRFGAGSAARHSIVATALDAGPGLRTDVDTAEDLAAAERLGTGGRTAELKIGVGQAISRSC